MVDQQNLHIRLGFRQTHVLQAGIHHKRGTTTSTRTHYLAVHGSDHQLSDRGDDNTKGRIMVME